MVNAMRCLLDALRQLQLGRVRARARDFVRARLLGILKTELEMIQAGVHQSFQARFAESDAGSDQVDVEPAARPDFDQSCSASGLASGSPPVRCNCRTPSAAASPKTRCHSSVVSSSARERISSGFEQ